LVRHKAHLAKAAVILALCTAAFSQKPDWKDYEYREDGFAVAAPFKPKFEKDLVDTAAGRMEVHTYNIEAGLFWNLAVSINDISMFGDLPAKELLQAAKNGSLTEVKGKLIAEKEISLNGAPGIEYEIATPDYHSLTRCYYVNGRTIAQISTAKTGLPFALNTDRFFSSLRFIPAWEEYRYETDGFALTTPLKLSIQENPVATAQGQVQAHLYKLDLGNDSGVMINVADYGRIQIAPDALEAVKNGMAQSAKAKVLSEKKITIDSNPGVEFDLDSETYHARARCYIIDSKVLIVIAFAGSGHRLPAGATRILDSLRLLSSQKQ
jgi:hypothetical protein